MTARLSTFRFKGVEYTVLSEESSKADLSKLTGAEREVMALVIDGLSNAQIATKRNASVRTVANQVQSVFRKLGVSSRAELLVRVAR